MGASSHNNNNFSVGLNSPVNYGDCSYIHSVLQCLLMHPIMERAQNIRIMNPNNKMLTTEIFHLYNEIKQRRTANSKNIIDLFYKIADEKKDSLGNDCRFAKRDPFHFLFYLLYLLHMELNESPGNFDLNKLLNLPIFIKKMEGTMENMFIEYLNKMHANSVIFKYFFWIEKNLYLCNKCGSYYDFIINHIFSMNIVDIYNYKNRLYPNRVQSKISLDDCFDYYCNYTYIPCEYCNSPINKTKKIFNGKTLIIRFKRNNLGNVNDVDFPNQFNFSKHSGLAVNDNSYNLYVLKSCISFGTIGNNRKYFADINVDVGNTGKWVRYVDSSIFDLSDNDITFFEPQLLIYELKNLESNYNNNPNMPNNNGNIPQNNINKNFQNNNNNNNFNNVQNVNNNFTNGFRDGNFSFYYKEPNN